MAVTVVKRLLMELTAAVYWETRWFLAAPLLQKRKSPRVPEAFETTAAAEADFGRV